MYASPATGGESFGIVLLEAMAAGTPIVCSDIHGYKGVVRRDRRPCSSRPGSRASSRSPSTGSCATRALRDRMGAAGRARAEEFSWPRVTAKVEDYYGFVIRRLAASGSLPEGFRAEIPQASPPLRARPSIPLPVGPGDPAESGELPGGLPEAALARDSARASRHTEAE